MDSMLAALVMVALPILLGGYFVYSRDNDKESIGLLFKLFTVGGLASVVLVFLVGDFVGAYVDSCFDDIGFAYSVAYNFIAIALVEEVCKWVMIRTLGYRAKAFDEVYDIVIFAVMVGFGFSFFEDVLYVMDAEDGMLDMAVARAITNIPGHPCFAAVTGYFMARARKCQETHSRFGYLANMVLSLAVPVMLHGAYDLSCEYTGGIGDILFMAVFIGCYVLFFRIIRKTSRENHRLGSNGR